jgi:hypothetical protein
MESASANARVIGSLARKGATQFPVLLLCGTQIVLVSLLRRMRHNDESPPLISELSLVEDLGYRTGIRSVSSLGNGGVS